MDEITGKFTSNEWSSLLMGETLLFGLLGQVLYANPGREWVETLIQADLFDSAPFAEDHPDMIRGLAILSQWTASVKSQLTDAELLDLRADYAQLFVTGNPMLVPPWESVYFSEERLTFQAQTLDVRDWFHRLGLRVGTGTNEPDDHIAFELSFIGHCAELAFHALKDRDTDSFAKLLGAQRAFLEQHLLRWGCKWADLAAENARTPFYSGLALMVRGGLKELARVLEVDFPEKIRYPGLDGE